MDWWRAALSAFVTVFLAELGDKTQLSTLVLAAKTRAPVAVFIGASLALSLATLLAVALGEKVTDYIPASFIRTAAGLAFVGIGLMLLMGKS